jgi:hypothetical protein
MVMSGTVSPPAEVYIPDILVAAAFKFILFREATESCPSIHSFFNLPGCSTLPMHYRSHLNGLTPFRCGPHVRRTSQSSEERIRLFAIHVEAVQMAGRHEPTATASGTCHVSRRMLLSQSRSVILVATISLTEA